MNFKNKNIKSIKGDASFRKFYRKKNKHKTSIIVYADKQKEKNLLIYDAINKLLLENKILAPRLYNHNYKNNYIEIEDLGKKTLFDLLKKKKINQLKYFKKIVKILINIQKINKKKIKNFKNNNYKIPTYKKNLLFKETSLFFNWYVPKVITKKKVFYINKILKKKVNLLLSKIKLSNNTFVHRDFHVSNLMINNRNNFGVIDSQDALYGNKAYDLASLIDDVRLKTSIDLKNSIYNYYLNLNRNKFDKKAFKNDFEILSVLRNLKIIGIFTRLAIRDKKKKYLKLIPHAWNLIEFRLENNFIFNDIKNFLDNNFSRRIRKKK